MKNTSLSLFCQVLNQVPKSGFNEIVMNKNDNKHKREYPDIEVKASVNMGIGSIQAMEYVSDYFDSFYLKRELNRYLDEIKPLRKWCNNNNKLYMLANSVWIVRSILFMTIWYRTNAVCINRKILGEGFTAYVGNITSKTTT
jgi:hypothetical protein